MRRGHLWLALALSAAPAMRADVMVATSINLTSFTITPSSGTVQISDVSTVVNAQAADDLGELDATSGTTSTSAAVSLASASASADGSGFTTSSASGVNIPLINAAVLAGSTYGNSQISGEFEIVASPGGANPVNVSFGAVLTGNQSLFTDPYGISAASDVTFQLQVPGLTPDPFLFYDNKITIGSDTTSSTPVDQTLSGSASLLTNTEYSFFLETDSESDGFAATPEPSSLLLMATLLASCAAARRMRRG